jgi:glycosyltransferase involved in cell wall biosynthesis
MEQLDSILSQSLMPNEIIIIEDNPSDSCADIIHAYMRKNKKILFFQNKVNLGVVGAFKAAVSKATGDIIFLSDQDDIWNKNKIEKIMDVFFKRDIDLVACGYRLIDENGEFLNKKRKILEKSSYVKFEKIIKGNVFPGCTMAFNVKIKKKFLAMPSECYIHDWYIAIISAAYKRFYFLKDNLVKYRIHNNNTIGFNTSLRPKFSKHRRIKNINDRISLLKMVYNEIDIKERKNLIEKVINFYIHRIFYLTENNIFMCISYGLKNISKYSNIRAFLGDIFIIVQDKIHV